MTMLKNRSGFTLVEILIAAGLISGLALAVSSMLNTGTKGSKKISQDLEIASLQSTALGSLRDPKSCQESLDGMNFAAAQSTTPAGGWTMPTIFKLTGLGVTIPLLAGGGTYATGTISSVKIPLNGIKVYGYDGTSIATVQITYERTGITTGNAFTTREFKIFVTDLAPTGGAFQKATDSCYAGDNPFNCADLGGDEDPVTKVCRSLNLYEATPNTTAAAATTLLERALTVNGDLVIAANGAESNPELLVNGTTTTTGDTITGGNFVLKENQMLRLSAVGNMEIVAGMTTGSGANIELQTANAFIDADNTTFRTRAGADGAAVKINGTQTVGPAATTLTAGTVLTVGGNSNLRGTVSINGTPTLGTFLTVNGNSDLKGTVSMNNGIVTTDGAGLLYLNKSPTELGPPGVNGTLVVNKDWVYNMLTGTMVSQLSTTQKEDIVKYIMANTGATSYIAIRDSISDWALGRINLLGGSPTNCPAGQFMNRVSYNTLNGRFNFTCAVVTDDCTINGNCGNLFSNNMVGADRFCVRRPAPKNWSCISSGGRAFWGTCSFSGGGNLRMGALPRPYWACPDNHYAIGSRVQANASTPAQPFCCPVQLVE